MVGIRTGNQALIEQFLCDSMNVMFGNPGTVEQGFIDAISQYSDMKYILALHESSVIMMADAYARYFKKPALAQIHSTPGLGNSIGAMYQAMKGHSPIVVIGGDAGIKYMPMEAQMYGDLVEFAKPVTKMSFMVKDKNSVLRIIRRAIKVAATPPMGPVYVCLPADILDEVNTETVIPSLTPITYTAPTKKVIAEISQLLLNSKKPIIYAGDGVAYSDASAELEKLSNLLGAEVWLVDSGELNIDNTAPMYQGQTGHMFGSSSIKMTKSGDVNLILGTYMMPEVYPELKDIFKPDSKIIHIDLDSYSIAKNHRVDIGVISDIKLTLKKLIKYIKSNMTDSQEINMKQRFEVIKKSTDLKRKQNKLNIVNSQSKLLNQFLEYISAYNLDNTIIFDEALTCSSALNAYMPPKIKDSFFQTRGGSLGVGIPAAIALKLACPQKNVIAFCGDGGSMYTIQSLWTAARYKIDAKFVILSNKKYGLLEQNIDEYWKENNINSHNYPECFELVNPTIDFEKIAMAQGVEATTVKDSKDIEKAVDSLINKTEPFLVNLII